MMRTALHKLLLSATLVALGTAGTARQSCFSRTYSKAHLKANPNQTVEKLSLRFEGPATNDQTTGEWADVNAQFLDDPVRYTQTLYCSFYNDNRYCGVECDGGQAQIIWKNEDTILVKTEGFIVSGGCDTENQTERHVKDNAPGSTTFRLNRASMQACPPIGD